MTARRRWLLALIVLAGVINLGCNPFVAPYFLMFGANEMVQPEFPLAAGPLRDKDRDKDKPVRVVLLCSAGMGIPPEFVGIDKSLAQKLAAHVGVVSRANKEKLEVVPASQVDLWKSKHPAWRTLKSEQIGKEFDADYVIDMEIVSMSMYEPGSHNQFYRGRAHVSITVLSGRPGAEGPVFNPKEYTCVYPEARGAVSVDMDTPPEKFKEEFIAYVVTDLAWLFTAHAKEEEYHRPN